MRSHRTVALAGLVGWLALCLLLPANASAELVREIPLNSKVKGSVETDGGADTYSFDAVAGLKLTVTLKGGSKSVLPYLQIADAQGTLLDVPGPSPSGKTKAKNLLLTLGGRYRLRVTVARAGSYQLKLSADSAKQKMEMVIPENGQAEATFESFAGADLKVSAKRSEKDGPRPVFDSLSDPDDDDVPAAGTIKESSKGFKIKKLEMPKVGAYRMAVSHEGGVAGTCEVEISLSDPPKGGTLSEDDLVAGRLEKIIADGPEDNDEGWFFRAEVLDTPSVVGVTLEIPGKEDRELERDTSSGLFSILEGYASQAELDADFPDGTYTIRIDRGEEEEDLTIESTVAGAYPAYPMPGSPSAPQDGDWAVSLTPTIWWDAVPGAVSYDADLQREGYGSILLDFESEDSDDRQFTVPSGVLVEGPVYRLTLVAKTEDGKTSIRTTRFTTASAGTLTDARMSKVDLKHPISQGRAGIEDWHFEVEAGFTGAGVLRAQVEPAAPTAFNPIPVSPKGNDNDFLLQWRFERVEWLPGIWLIDAYVPDDTYQIRVIYLDGSEEVSDPLVVGGDQYRIPKYKQGPRQGEAANVLTPSWAFIQGIYGSGPPPTRGYTVILEDAVSGEVVSDEDIEGYWDSGNYQISYRAPNGALKSKHEYKMTLNSSNGSGKDARIWLSFNTGDIRNDVSFATASKVFYKDSEGNEKFQFIAETGGQTLDTAHVRGPLGALLALKKDSLTGSFKLKINFDSEEDLDTALPDGRYRFLMEYNDGSPDTQRYFEIFGGWPTFPEITTPMPDEKKVVKDPGIAWLFPIEEPSRGFNVFISRKGSSNPAWGNFVQAGSFDTRVAPPIKLEGGKKYELEVYALGPTGKNSVSSLYFTTKD